MSAVPARHGSTPTCCCRSRRSPRPPARSSIAKDALQAFNGVVQAARRDAARRGRCCACSARCWGCRASTSNRSTTSATSLPAAADDRGEPARTTRRRRDRAAGDASRAGSSASPTCRSISPIRSCAARRRCSRPPTRSRRSARMNARRCSTQLGVADGAQVKVRQGRGEAVLTAVARRRRAARRRAHRRRASVDLRPRGPVRARHRGARLTWTRCIAHRAGRGAARPGVARRSGRSPRSSSSRCR